MLKSRLNTKGSFCLKTQQSEFALNLLNCGRVLTDKRLLTSESGKEFEFSAQLSKLESDAQNQKELIYSNWLRLPHLRAFHSRSSAKMQELTEQLNS